MSPRQTSRVQRSSETRPATEFSFSLGRVALYAVLRAIGVERDDEVILTGYTCVVVASSVKFLGARCRYVDIDPRTWGTSPRDLESVASPRAKVLVVQHTYGIPADMDPILEWAGPAGVRVIEDCALTVGSRYRGRETGTFGAAAFWSGQHNKPLPVGLGGFLRVNDDALVDAVQEQWSRARPSSVLAQLSLGARFEAVRAVRGLLPPRALGRLRALSRARERRGPGESLGPECVGEMPEGYLSRGGAVQSWRWRRGLSSWPRQAAHRARIAGIYRSELPRLGFRAVKLASHEDVVFSRYPVRVANKTEVLRAAEREAVEIGEWMDQPLHQAAAPLERWDYRDGMCPEGEKAARETINLPNHTRVGKREAVRVLEFLRRNARPA